MISLSPKILLQLQVLMVCEVFMVASKSNATSCSCYVFYNQNATGTQSEKNCSRDGGHLVTMETKEEWKFVNLEIQKRNTYMNEWYIGLKNESVSNEWKWVNNTISLAFYKWQPGEPLGDGRCVIMAKNYPKGTEGSWNDLPCNTARGFICENDQGSYKCNSSNKIHHCFGHYIPGPRPTERASTTTTCVSSVPGPDQFRDLIYVVIALGILLAGGIAFYIYIFYCKNRNTGFSLGCPKFRCCKLKTRISNSSELILEEGAAPLQTEPTTETEIERDDCMITTDREDSPESQDPVQDTVEDAVNPDYTSPADPNPISPYASLYTTLEVEQKNPEENEDITPPKVPSPYHKTLAPEEPVVYATVDKSKKKGRNSHIEVVYATVDKKRKNQKADDSEKIQESL